VRFADAAAGAGARSVRKYGWATRRGAWANLPILVDGHARLEETRQKNGAVWKMKSAKD
jgi:hypothetical protein